MEEYIVGGAVRDILLGRPPREYDIAFTGTVEGFICRNPSARKAGNDFPIFIKNGLEYAPLRGETIHDDLALRDFTINALALDGSGKIIAHPRSFSDLQHRILRPAGPDALNSDPVRAFRAARFAALLPDFSVHEQTLEQMAAVAESGVLHNITPERVAGELQKALQTPKPGNFLRMLHAGNCLTPWFAEFSNAATIPAGPLPFHDESVLEHTAQIMDRCTGDAVAVFMALCHDIGKPQTPHDLLPHHYKHEHRGETAARQLAQRLKLPNRLGRAGELAARHHMKGGMYATLRTGTRVDMLMALNRQSLLSPFARLVHADSGTDYTARMHAERDAILRVNLPAELRNLGPESGKRLRELRCQTLAAMA